MDQTLRQAKPDSTTSQWRLWIDRCGGFGLFVSDQCKLGGARPNAATDIQVRCDWRRVEGVLKRRSGDYFWSPSGETGEGMSNPVDSEETLLVSDQPMPIPGSATLRLSKPSPLSGSAVLTLDPPHRFDGHIDQVLLVDQTILIGSSAGNHIRCPSLDSAAVLVNRDGRWFGKLKASRAGAAGPSDFVDIVPGERVTIGDLDLMMEEV